MDPIPDLFTRQRERARQGSLPIVPYLLGPASGRRTDGYLRR